MKRILIVFAASFFLLSPTLVKAAEYKVPDETGNILISQDESHKNLYAAGGNVKIESNTAGDLVIAGGTLDISGNVEQGLIVAGGTITTSGSIGQNARIAGGTVTIESAISEDLFVAGRTIYITDKTIINGDLVISGGTVNIAGKIRGNVIVNGGTIKISGEVGGNVNAKYVDILTVTDSARVKGNLTYSSSKEGSIHEPSIDGTVSFHKAEKVKYGTLIMPVFYSLLGMILALIIIVYLLPKSATATVNGTLENFWSKIGIGLLTLITIPIIAILISAVTVGVGFSLSAILGLIYILVLVLAGVLTPLVVGRLVISLIKKERQELDWLTVIVGAVAAITVGYIPVAGPLFLFIIFLLILGQLSKQAWLFLQKQR